MMLADLSIRRPIFAWMLIWGLILFGALSFQRMGVSQMPDVDFPVVNIQLSWEGASPEIMESDVVDVVEDVVMTVEGLREITSSIRHGQANVTLEFELGRNLDVVVQEVQTKLAQAQRKLPNDLDPPIVTKVNPQDQPIMWIGIWGDLPKRDLMDYVQNHLRDQFQAIPGVGEVMLGGFLERNLRIWVDAEKLATLQLTVEDIIRAIQQEHAELPAGRIETQRKEYNVRSMGEASSVEEFGNIRIPTRAGQPIHTPIFLKDVAWIEDGLADVRRIARIMGRPAVGLGIKKQRGANEVEVARRVIEKMEKLKKGLPPAIEMGVNFNRTRFVEESIQELIFTLTISVVLTSLVCWLFLGSISATFNILMAIPTSIIGTFIPISFLGFTLNTFTLLGLTLAIGIVVDDAIMVMENIARHQERGESRIEAARQGTHQIAFAALAATLSIIVIFLPVAFMEGIIGKFLFQFGVTISIAVALSLLEALTLTPMRCAQFLHLKQHRHPMVAFVDGTFQRLARLYGDILPWCLRHHLWVLFIALILFLSSIIWIGPRLPREFVPPQDQSMFLCRLQTPVGSSLEFTDERFRQAEAFAMSRPEVQRYFGAIGGFGGGEVDTGILFVTLKPPSQRPIVPPNRNPLSQRELMAIFRKELNKIPDVRAVIQDLSLVGLTAQRGFPIEMAVRGPDWDMLASYARRIEEAMKANPLFVDVDSDYLEGATEIRVIPDRQSAAEHGVHIETIGRTLRALVGGERVAKFTRSGRRYDVRIRLLPHQRTGIEDIHRLWVWNNRGELVPLNKVVRTEERPSHLVITRRGRQRAITLFANVAPGQSQQAAIEEAERIAKSVLPEGYDVAFGGATQTFRESTKGLIFALWLGLGIAYMILASQYNNLLHPLAILLALPFGISGALLALWWTGRTLNLYSAIGIILLMGIAKKNSILLVDFTNRLRQEGKTVRQALEEACPIRLRPILMTSLSTIAAAIPPAMALGPGAETRIPMAVVIMGGMFVSTLLTLFVVPCCYLALSRLERPS